MKFSATKISLQNIKSQFDKYLRLFGSWVISFELILYPYYLKFFPVILIVFVLYLGKVTSDIADLSRKPL